MNYTIKLFGITREIVGANQQVIASDSPLSVEALLALLKEQYPPLKNIRSLLVAVNSEYANPETMIDFSAEIALIPPVSGG